MDTYITPVDIDWDANKLREICLNDPAPWKPYGHGHFATVCKSEDPYITEHILPQLNELGYQTLPRLGFGYYLQCIRARGYLRQHTDMGRSAAINFPIEGEWDKSPLRLFCPTGKNIVAEHVYTPNQAIYFKTSRLHDVINESNKQRLSLSISLIEKDETINTLDGEEVFIDDKYLQEMVRINGSVK